MSATVPEVSAVVKLPLSVADIYAILLGDTPHVFFRPAVESLGMDYATQKRKIQGRSWATVGSAPMVAADGRVRMMDAIPYRTFAMWASGVNENRVHDEDVRRRLIAFQCETADAIESYWTRGGTINPRATESQRADMMQRLQTLEDFHHHIVEEGRDFSVREAASFINRDHDLMTGQNLLFEILRKWGMLDHRNRPYAKHKAHVVWSLGGEYRDQYGELRIGAPQVRVTVTGLLYIHSRLRRELS